MNSVTALVTSDYVVSWNAIFVWERTMTLHVFSKYIMGTGKSVANTIDYSLKYGHIHLLKLNNCVYFEVARQMSICNRKPITSKTD